MPAEHAERAYEHACPSLGPLKRLISSKAFVWVSDDPTQRLRNFIYSLMFGGMPAGHPHRPSTKIDLVEGFRVGAG
jgi:hypothetical protein